MNKGVFSKIYEVVKQIPEGKVATYGQIAKRCKIYNACHAGGQVKSKIDARIVGYALHANKDLKVPCHRVVDRNGQLAKNYAFGGIKEQKRKLVSEGVVFKSEFQVDLFLAR